MIMKREGTHKLFFTILDISALQVNNIINTAMKSAINRPALGAWADDFCPLGQRSFFSARLNPEEGQP